MRKRAAAESLGTKILEYGKELYDKKTTAFYKEIAPRTRSTNQTYIEFIQETDFAPAPIVKEGQVVPLDDFQTPYTLRVRPVKRGVRYIATSETEEEDQVGILKKAGAKIGKAFNDSKEFAAAHLINNATNSALTWADGQPVASTSHPIDGGTASNLITTPLSMASIEEMLQMLRLQVSHRGNPAPYVGPVVLFVHPSQYFLAKRLVESAGYPGTGDNDKNVAGPLCRVHANPYFTNTFAHAVKAVDPDEQGFVLLNRRPFRSRMREDIDRDVRVYVATEMYAFYIDTWRGYVHSTGLGV